MEYLGIPANQMMKWDVPIEWQYAYRRATGWSHKDTVRQLKLSQNFKLDEKYALRIRDAEIFVNPSKKEMAQILRNTDEVRFTAFNKPKKIYVWNAFLALHDEVAGKIGKLGWRSDTDRLEGIAKRMHGKLVANRSDQLYYLLNDDPDTMEEIFSKDWSWIKKYGIDPDRLIKSYKKKLDDYLGINEKYAFMDKDSMGRPFEIFVNPSKKELNEITKTSNYIRFSAIHNKKRVYVWSADKEIHYHVNKNIPEMRNVKFTDTFSGVAKKKGQKYITIESDYFDHQKLSIREEILKKDWSWLNIYHIYMDSFIESRKVYLEQILGEKYAFRFGRRTTPASYEDAPSPEVFVNPSKKEFREAAQTAGAVRFYADDLNKKVYIWDAIALNHYDAWDYFPGGVKKGRVYDDGSLLAGQAIVRGNTIEFDGSDNIVFGRDAPDRVRDTLTRDWSWVDKYIPVTRIMKIYAKRYL